MTGKEQLTIILQLNNQTMKCFDNNNQTLVPILYKKKKKTQRK